ncbi:MAG: hypothetical protein JW924_06100 [Fusobacteriaceae bacterium]|nr:hypothetical protein [Fusobacteriaceae bacterium]
MDKLGISTNVAIMIFTALAAYATTYEYIIKYRRKKRNICRLLLSNITNVKINLLKFQKIDTDFYDENKNFIECNFESIESIHKVYYFIKKYNLMLDNEKFRFWLEDFVESKNVTPSQEIHYKYNFPFIKEEGNKFSYSLDLNSKTFSNIEYYNFIDEVHNFKYDLYSDVVIYLFPKTWDIKTKIKQKIDILKQKVLVMIKHSVIIKFVLKIRNIKKL